MQFKTIINLAAIFTLLVISTNLYSQKNQKKGSSQKQKVTKCLTSRDWNYSEATFGFNTDGSGYYKVGVLEPDNGVTWKYIGGNSVKVYIPYIAENGMNVTVKTNGGCKVYFPY